VRNVGQHLLGLFAGTLQLTLDQGHPSQPKPSRRSQSAGARVARASARRLEVGSRFTQLGGAQHHSAGSICRPCQGADQQELSLRQACGGEERGQSPALGLTSGLVQRIARADEVAHRGQDRAVDQLALDLQGAVCGCA